MATFHGFIPENCIGRDVLVIVRDSYAGTEIRRITGQVIKADEDCLYLDDGTCVVMKYIERGDLSLKWLS